MIYLSNRDGSGKTDEEGHFKVISRLINGERLGLNLIRGSGLSVDIGPGQFAIPTSDNYSYFGWSDANETLYVPAPDPLNPRQDIIVLYVDRSASTSPVPANNPGIVKFAIVTGTPSSTSSLPTDQEIKAAIGVNNPFIKLYNYQLNPAITSMSTVHVYNQGQDMKMALQPPTLDFGSVPMNALDLNSAISSQFYWVQIGTNGYRIENPQPGFGTNFTSSITSSTYMNVTKKKFFGYITGTEGVATEIRATFAGGNVRWHLNDDAGSLGSFSSSNDNSMALIPPNRSINVSSGHIELDIFENRTTPSTFITGTASFFTRSNTYERYKIMATVTSTSSHNPIQSVTIARTGADFSIGSNGVLLGHV